MRERLRQIFSGILLLVVAAAMLEGTALIQMFFSQKGLRNEASLRAESEMETAGVKILDIANQAEAAVRNSEWIAQWCMAFPDSLVSVSRRIVEDNPVVVGSTVALVPGYDRKRPLFSPYVCRDGDGLAVSSLATEEYDYPSQEWFVKPLEVNGGHWSEPYLDEGGGNILMTTYSMPVSDYEGRQAAVITADISLDWLSDLIADMEVYPGAQAILYSRGGEVMVQTGPAPEGKTTHFSSRVERTGWTMSITIPDKEIFGSIRRLAIYITLLQLIGVILLAVIIRSASKSEKKYQKIHKAQERMEGDLKIASSIQMSMIPKADTIGPEYKELDIAASILPAKEVGGDLYDFFLRNGRLYFCIGDVSGKGIPASLVMAVTRSSFRTLVARESSPAAIVTAMNDGLAEMNENNMFVTFFCGVLELDSGRLRYCNAGHNAPLILTDAIRQLPVQPNLPLAVIRGMSFPEQETVLKPDDALFLFTDGLTEAENIDHELFGDARVDAALRCRRTAENHLKAMTEAVSAFVGDAPQSDDLTMLFIHYLGTEISGSITLRNDIADLPLLSEFVRKTVGEAGMDGASIELALEEAVTNVMQYAYPAGVQGSVEVSASIEPESVRFTVADEGNPFDPTAAPDPDVSLSAEDRPIGGLGIFLVRQIMDSVAYAREGNRNILTMIKKR